MSIAPGSGSAASPEGENDALRGTGNVAKGNLIGTDAVGVENLHNGGNGVLIESLSGNMIGGSGTDGQIEHNVISGNERGGIHIEGSDANTVSGNIIGLTAGGYERLSNRFSGVLIINSSDNHIVNGNTISANSTGVYIGAGSGVGMGKSSNNRVQGNRIGTDIEGMISFPDDPLVWRFENASHGVMIVNASDTLIGGKTDEPGTGLGNIISGNGQVGVFITGSEASDNKIQGNLIGPTSTGPAWLSNRQGGVFVFAPRNTIGGATEEEQNVIHGSGGTGVHIGGVEATGNIVQGNRISSSHGDGIRIDAGASDNLIGGALADGALPGSVPGNIIENSGYERFRDKANFLDGWGIKIAGSNNKIYGNFVGPESIEAEEVNRAWGNYLGGIWVWSGVGNRIGGESAAYRNVISGNGGPLEESPDFQGGHGVFVSGGPKTSGTRIQDNFIGTTIDGKRSGRNRTNAGDGIVLTSGEGNVIGGPTSQPGEAPGNVISGNNRDGIRIVSSHPEHANDKIQGNMIGTNANGDTPVPNGRHGIVISGSEGVTIGGAQTELKNVISGNDQDGVYIVGSSDTKVEGNFIGTTVDGTQELANGKNGVTVIESDNNTVGGTETSSRNLISGNAEHGIRIEKSSYNKVQGNYIGTDKDGGQSLPNGNDGVSILHGSYNLIGGATSQPGASPGNVVSGNGEDGIVIESSTELQSGFNQVQGNLIGTNAAGDDPLGNGTTSSSAMNQKGRGVRIFASRGNTIGGTQSATRNVISANSSSGILMEARSEENKVQSNYIGTDASGRRLGNAYHGVSIVDSNENQIGGLESNAANLIAFNGLNLFPLENHNGVAVIGQSYGNSILSNRIYDNGGVQIDLNQDGPTPNDPSDSDDGPNSLQNYPTFDATVTPTSTIVSGKLEGTRSHVQYTLQFFSANFCHLNRGSADVLLGTRDVTAPVGGGTAEFTFAFPIRAQGFVTATATDASLAGEGGTSEFSECFTPLQDNDADRIPDVVEDEVDGDDDGVPDGDGNNDGIVDRDQPHVTSFPDFAQQRYVTLVSEETTTLADVQPQDNPSPDDTPPDAVFPMGFLGFRVEDITPGGSTTVTMLLPPDMDVNTYYNFGPTPDDPTDHWYPFLFNGTTGAEVLDDRIVLHYVDGGFGDHDQMANGTILDPGGPAFVVFTTGSISGYVYADVNNNGAKEPHELGLPNVPITVDGPVTSTVVTGADGRYEFADLPVGQYTVTQAQPSAFNDGIETLGPTQLGHVEGEGFAGLNLPAGANAEDYNFGERGLRGEFVSRQLMNRPLGDQFVLDLTGGIGFGGFQANRNGTFTADAEGEGLASIELYTSDMMPVAIGAAGELPVATVAEGESYVLLVTGSDGPVNLQTAIQTPTPVYLTNALNPMDVDGNGMTTPLDVLVLISALNAGSIVDGSQVYYVDVNSDKQLTSLDVLTVINHLTANATQSSATGGEGEPSSQFELPFEPDAASPSRARQGRAEGPGRDQVGTLSEPLAGLSQRESEDKRERAGERVPSEDDLFVPIHTKKEPSDVTRDSMAMLLPTDLEGNDLQLLGLEEILPDITEEIAHTWAR